ncbi:MAG TPA: redoxin domain-containing protein [Methanotrichaceae archaeon]|nr:redoxin domain-containing protein [Methanotrichaceae archaeon]
MKVGEKAKDFVLDDHKGEKFKLSDLKGKRVLLSFHPLAWTSICAEQMKSLEANFERLEVLNAVAVGISVDSVPCKKAWAESLGIEKIRILADFWPHGEVAKLYGTFREENGFSERANAVVDENGKIAWFKVYEISTLPDIEEILVFLKNMG